MVTETQLAALLDVALNNGPHNVLLFLQEKVSIPFLTLEKLFIEDASKYVLPV